MFVRGIFERYAPIILVHGGSGIFRGNILVTHAYALTSGQFATNSEVNGGR